jgi:hypothetical protein
VQVIEPTSAEPPPVEIRIPLEIPSSRWNHLAIARFDQLPRFDRLAP